MGKVDNLDINKEFVVRRKIKGAIFELDLYKPTQRSIYYAPLYERENLKLTFKYLQQNSTFIDVGAHIGYYSILIGKNVRGVNVISFEPSKENYDILCKNIELNNLKKIVTPFPFAVSDKNETTTLYLNPFNDGGNSLEQLPHQALKEEKVQCVRLDDFLKEHNYYNINFIKIDVEGHEMKVLHGMPNTILKFHPTFLIEAQTKNEQNEIVIFLKSFGYSHFHLNSYHLDILCKY